MPGANSGLVTEAVAIPMGIQAEILDHLQILVHRLVERGEVVADHERAGPGHENHALGIAQVGGAAPRHHDFLPGQDQTETRDGLEDFQDREGRVLGKGRAGNRVQDVHRHHIGADGLQLERQVAAIFAGFTHPDDAPGANLDASLLQVADGLQTVFKRVRGAGLGKEATRAFQVVAVTFHARLLEPVGHDLALDDAQRNVRPGLAAGFHLPHARADLVQHGTFIQAFPGGHQAHGGDVMAAGLVGRFRNGFGVHETVFGGAGLVEGRLGAEAAVFRTGSGLGVDDGAKMNLVALELFADAVGPRQQIQDIRGGFQVEQPEGLVAGDLPAAEDPLAEPGNSGVMVCVNRLRCHG